LVLHGSIRFCRVNRTRIQLAAISQMENQYDLGPDRLLQSALEHLKATAPVYPLDNLRGEDLMGFRRQTTLRKVSVLPTRDR
jgi:hypothetical protein